MSADDVVVLAVEAQDGQYHLRSKPEMDNPWPGSPDGLLTGEAGWIAVLTGTEFGSVPATFRVHPHAPPLNDHDWDMAVERTLDCPDGEITVASLYSSDSRTVRVPAGFVRLRVSVRNRGSASVTPAQAPEQPEAHLIDAWSVPEWQPSRVVAGPDETAQYRIS
ncbi:hypothetical protein DMP23_47680 [Amycolatopsis sp. A1MSW2902]|uniref:hypothetical protein n=1 Tax=Amycolatopsis sp. A1MSW2902 TaxID=687413 RepID=UPI00307D332A